MQFVVLLMWLCVSNAVLLLPAVALVEAGNGLWGLAAAIGLPALRIAARYRPHRGYRLIGYNDGAGGDFTQSGGRLTRQRQPQRFGLLVGIEIVIVVLLVASILLRP